MVFILLESVLEDSRIISASLRSLGIPFLDENLLMQVTMYWNSDIFINFLIFLYGMEWQPHHMRSLTVRMDCSMPPIFSLAAHVCRSADDRKTWMCSNSLLT